MEELVDIKIKVFISELVPRNNSRWTIEEKTVTCFS